MKALFFSDMHFHVWAQYNEANKRLKAQLKTFKALVKKAAVNKVPLFFCGDLFHEPEGLSNKLINQVLPLIFDIMNSYEVTMYAINGNHDFSEKSSWDHRSPGYITGLSLLLENLICLDFDSVDLGDIVVHGVPYIHGNKDYPEVISRIQTVPGKFNILINHTDYAGQKDVGDIVVGSGENIQIAQLRKFSLVCSGHIHRPGLYKDRIYSIGSPVQTRVSDIGYDFGHWVLTDDYKMEFVKTTGIPLMKYYEDEPEDDYHIWIKKPKPITRKGSSQVEVISTSKKDLIEAYIKAEDLTKSQTKFLRSLC